MNRILISIIISVLAFSSPALAQSAQQSQGYENALKGYSYWKNNHPTQAIYWFQKALLFDPTNPEYLASLGAIHLDFKEYYQAIHWLKRTVELKPTDGKSWYNLGKAYLELGELEPAKFSFSQAVWYNPHDDLSKLALNWIRVSNLKRTQAVKEKSATPVMQLEPQTKNMFDASTLIPPVLSLALPGAGQIYSGIITEDQRLMNLLSGGLYLSLSGISYGFIFNSIQQGESLEQRWPWLALLGLLTIASPLQAYFLQE